MYQAGCFRVEDPQFPSESPVLNVLNQWQLLPALGKQENIGKFWPFFFCGKISCAFRPRNCRMFFWWQRTASTSSIIQILGCEFHMISRAQLVKSQKAKQQHMEVFSSGVSEDMTTTVSTTGPYDLGLLQDFCLFTLLAFFNHFQSQEGSFPCQKNVEVVIQVLRLPADAYRLLGLAHCDCRSNLHRPSYRHLGATSIWC